MEAVRRRTKGPIAAIQKALRSVDHRPAQGADRSTSRAPRPAARAALMRLVVVRALVQRRRRGQRIERAKGECDDAEVVGRSKGT